MSCAFCGPASVDCEHGQHEINGQPVCCACFVVAQVMTRRSIDFFPYLMDTMKPATKTPITDEHYLVAFSADRSGPPLCSPS